MLLLTALSLLGAYNLGHSYINYKSDMQTINPAIKTPKAEGQVRHRPVDGAR